MDFVVPVYLENEVVFTDRLVLDIDLGAKAYYNYKTELKDYKVENVQDHSGSVFNRFVSPADYTRNMIDVSLFGMFNLEYGFTKKVFVTAAAGYEYGLNPSYRGNELYCSPSDGIWPFVSSSRETEDIAYRSIVGSVTYTRNALWLSLGFKFKL